MKKRGQTLLYLLLYMLLLSFALGFDVQRLVDFKNIGIFLVGTVLLTLPFCGFSKGNMWMSRFCRICGKRAMDAGMIQTFLLLFIRLSDEKAYEGLLTDVALCFRPMLYAFCVKLVWDREEDWADNGGSAAGDADRRGAGNVANVRCGTELEEWYRDLRFEDCLAAGLTRREAEIALLVCRRCSNGEIAEELVISQATVKKHLSNIFEKTGIKRREELQEYIARQVRTERGTEAGRD